MIEYVRTKLEQLLETLIAPWWSKLLAASWRVRLAALVVIAVVAAAAAFPRELWRLTKQGYYVPRTVWAGPTVVPISKATADRNRQNVQRLVTVVASELPPHHPKHIAPWTAAQGVLSVTGIGLADPAAFSALVRSQSDPSCSCWTELVGQPVLTRCFFISGWVLAALASLRVPATAGELAFLLDHQHAEGWWTTFAVGDRPEYASTYTTAWAVMGLRLQRAAGLVAAETSTRVDTAIRKGTAWLLSSRIQGTARWKPYPRLALSVPSESVSGTVLHALHVAGAHNLAQLDRQWLDSLPATIVTADQDEKNFVVLRTSSGEAVDHFVQIKLPWMLAATIDAFANGDVRQRARALEWIEQTLDHPSVAAAETQPESWWRAELLYALRHASSASAPAGGSTR